MITYLLTHQWAFALGTGAATGGGYLLLYLAARALLSPQSRRAARRLARRQRWQPARERTALYTRREATAFRRITRPGPRVTGQPEQGRQPR